MRESIWASSAELLKSPKLDGYRKTNMLITGDIERYILKIMTESIINYLYQ